MSGDEGDAAVVGADGGELDVLVALKEVIRRSLVHDGLVCGLRQAVKALDKKKAYLCVLSSSVDDADYEQLVTALCAERGIKLLKVPDSKQLGEWCGLCKMDAEGNARKVVGCSCAVIFDYGEPSDALTTLLEYLEK